MEEYIIAGSSGNFSINGTKYYRTPVRIKPIGDSVTILGADGSVLARGLYTQFLNGNDNNATFNNITALLNYFDTVFSSGGGGGEGATTDASTLTSGFLNPERLQNGSIGESKLSEEVREKLNHNDGNLKTLISMAEQSLTQNPRVLGVMENPPTITATNANPEPGLTKVYQAASSNSIPESSPFTYMGGRSKVYAGEYVRVPAVKLFPSGGNVDDGENAYSWRIGFNTDAPKISLGFLSGLTYRFIVDGQYVSKERTSLGSGQPTYITLDFSEVGGRKVREIMIEGVAAAGFHSLRVSPVDTVWKPNQGLRLGVVGQSYEQSAGAFYMNDGYVPIMGDYLGFSDVRQIAEGGTGYTVGTSKYIDRINDWTGVNTPDLLVLGGGLADIGSNPGDLKAAVSDLIHQTRVLLPKTPIITLAIMPASSGPSQIYLDKELEIKEAVEDLNDPLVKFIPVSTEITGSWLSGTGFKNNPNGSGNSDIYIGGDNGNDGTHPNNEGHEYLGVRAAYAVLGALKSMME